MLVAVGSGRAKIFRYKFFHNSMTCYSSGLKRRNPSCKATGGTVLIPGYIRAMDLAKKLCIDIGQVAKFARGYGYAFKRHSDIILDYEGASILANKFSIATAYEEVDVFRSDYWEGDGDMGTIGSKSRRPLVVSVMGEVDHGKTTLLDSICGVRVAKYETGEMTQCISGFFTNLNVNGTDMNVERSKITFIDTPGHGIFFKMCESGAMVSDCIVLVVSAVEGVEKRTLEILEMARIYCLPVVLVINKIDISDRVRIEAIYSEMKKLKMSKISRSRNPIFCGDYAAIFDQIDEVYPLVAIIEVSALLGTNIDQLKIFLMKLQEAMKDTLSVDFHKKPAEATVLESYNSVGIGKLLLSITHLGQLNRGDWFVVDKFIGMIKYMHVSEASNLSMNGVDCAITDRKLPLTSFGSKVDNVTPGLSVLVSGVRADEEVPNGSTIFTMEKERALMVQKYRRLLLEYKSREIGGTLWDPSKFAAMAVQKTFPANNCQESIIKKKYPNDNEESDMPEELKCNLSVIIKSNHQGRLDAILGESNALLDSYGWELKVLSSGLGDLAVGDLAVGRIEIEENRVERVLVYLHNVSVDSRVRSWALKNSKTFNSMIINRFDVFVDILEHMKGEIELKKKRREVKQRDGFC